MIFLRKITFYLALAGIAASVALVLRLRANEPVLPPPVAPPRKPVAQAIAASGLVEARRENTLLGVPVPGLVSEVLVKVWDQVEAGQPLIKLDDRELRASRLLQEANVAVAEASLRRVQDLCERRRKLASAQPPVISTEELEMVQNDLAVAQAQLAAARAAVSQTQLLMDRLVVKSPIAATILQVNLRAGEYASPTAPRPPLVLGHIDEVQVRADVDEQLAPRVKTGQKAVGYVKGDSAHPIRLDFVRIEPYVVPKVSLTGGSAERVDTRVLQVIYSFRNTLEHPVYVGQQMDVYLEQE